MGDHADPIAASGGLRDRDMGVLLEVASLLQASHSRESGFGALFKLLHRIIPYESATLYLVDPESGQLNCEEVYGDQEINLIDAVRFEMGYGLSAWIAKQSRPILIPVLRKREPEGGGTLRSFIGLPLVADDGLVGVMTFGHSHPGAFSAVDESPLRLLAAQIALVLKNITLLRRLHSVNTELAANNRRLREMQARLVESERLKAVGDVVATMNHEINNPLTIISGNAELLGLLLADQPEAVQEKLRTITQQVRRLGRVLSLLAQVRRTVSEAYPGEGRILDLEASARGGT
jgi:transcriptional regulator with GAF, ATPase, and Fis domain